MRARRLLIAAAVLASAGALVLPAAAQSGDWLRAEDEAVLVGGPRADGDVAPDQAGVVAASDSNAEDGKARAERRSAGHGPPPFVLERHDFLAQRFAGWFRDGEHPRNAEADQGSTSDTNPPDHAGRPGPPAHAGEPGPPAHAGEPGPPAHAGRPGPPAHAGRPDGAGPPDHAGRPGPPAHAGEPGPPPHVAPEGADTDSQ